MIASEADIQSIMLGRIAGISVLDTSIELIGVL